MNPEERRLLEEAAAQGRENHRLLNKLVGDLRWRRLWAALKWILVIAASLGLYYYLQPWLDGLVSFYRQLPAFLEQYRALFDSLPRFQ